MCLWFPPQNIRHLEKDSLNSDWRQASRKEGREGGEEKMREVELRIEWERRSSGSDGEKEGEKEARFGGGKK